MEKHPERREGWSSCLFPSVPHLFCFVIVKELFMVTHNNNKIFEAHIMSNMKSRTLYTYFHTLYLLPTLEPSELLLCLS